MIGSRAARLTAAQQAKLLERAARENGFGLQREAMNYLEEEFGIRYTQGGVCVLFQRLKIKAKVARPRNTRAVVEEQSEYKKTLRSE